MSRALSDEIIERARSIRENGANWTQTGKRLNCSVDALRRVLDPMYSSRRSELATRRKRHHDKLHGPAPRAGLVVSETLPPPEVVADRDWRRGQDLTLNQLLLGDPEPSRSALERGVTGNLGGCEGRFRAKPWDPRSKLRSVPDFAEG